MLNFSPAWFRALYLEQGEDAANWLDAHPSLKLGIQKWMDGIITNFYQEA